MPFQTIPVIVTGPSYQDRSRPLASQETKNFYHEVVRGSQEQYVLKSFPGLKAFGSVVGTVDRGATRMAEVIYRVVDQSLYNVDSFGTHTYLGSILGTARCIFANDGINLFVVTELKTYKYDGVSVTEITDPDISGSKSVEFFNNQFIYTKDKLSVVSEVGDGGSATSLNAIGAESLPDDLVRDKWFDQVLYRFGDRSVESWYNSGVGTPPIARIEGQIFSIGCAAIHSVINTKDALYWLGSDRSVYRTRGGVEEAISSTAISQAIESYSVVDDAFAFEFVLDGKSFVGWTFPTANQTWVLQEDLGPDGWFELSSGVDGEAWQVDSLVVAYGKILVGDQGNLFELSLSTFSNNGDVLQRRRVTSSINGKSIGAPGKRLQMSRFELIMEKGVGLITGQGEDPLIMIEYSTDGGKSWSEGTWMRAGRLGETDIRAEWFSMITFYDLMVRITTSDPVDYNIYSGAIDVRLAGR